MQAREKKHENADKDRDELEEIMKGSGNGEKGGGEIDEIVKGSEKSSETSEEL